MSSMRRLLAIWIFVALAGAGTAFANHLEPKRDIDPADQARARAILLKKADFGPGFGVRPSGNTDLEYDCPALDESDLTLTGDADSPRFAGGIIFVSSASVLFESVADANASWRREKSSGGISCATGLLRREFAKEGLTLVSLRKVAFPRVAQHTVAYRVTLSGVVQGNTVKVIVDLVTLMNSRAQAAIVFGSAFAAIPRANELALVRRTAGRMAKAMRGA
jgi:hypothetical protein